MAFVALITPPGSVYIGPKSPSVLFSFSQDQIGGRLSPFLHEDAVYLES